MWYWLYKTLNKLIVYCMFWWIFYNYILLQLKILHRNYESSIYINLYVPIIKDNLYK